MKRRSLILQVVILCLVAANLWSQNTRVTRSSFNMGYAESRSGNTVTKSVIGQPWVGTTQSSNTQIGSGILADTLFRGTMVEVKNQEQLPASASLLQNYPNPFNPSTRIKYTVGGTRGLGLGSSNTRLVVYDVLGREVAVLVNERQLPGRYEVTFDASGLASGVYFYRLQAEDFVQTRKLLLVR